MRGIRLIIAIAIAVVAVAGMSVSYVKYRRDSLNAAAKAYLDRELPVVVTHWSPDELLSQATPQFRAAISQQDLAGVDTGLTDLGQFWRFLSTTGTVEASYLPGGQISAKYVTQASFERGLGTFHITLVREGGRWRITGFHLDVLLFPPLGPRL